MSEQYTTDALQQWEDAMDLGCETGECGVCGQKLDGVSLALGLCHSCQVEFTELFDDESFTEVEYVPFDIEDSVWG